MVPWTSPSSLTKARLLPFLQPLGMEFSSSFWLVLLFFLIKISLKSFIIYDLLLSLKLFFILVKTNFLEQV